MLATQADPSQGEEYDETAAVEMTADEAGFVSHAGAESLRELADPSGLPARGTKAVIGTCRGSTDHLPGHPTPNLSEDLQPLTERHNSPVAAVMKPRGEGP